MRYFVTLLALSILPLTGCLSPRYTPPTLTEPLPTEFKEEGEWKTAQPNDSLDRGDWWLRFNDPVLNDLIRQANGANQNIAQAAANFRQAKTDVMSSRAAFMPGITGTASYTRSGGENIPSHQTKTSLGASASWEVTFWNAIPAFEASTAGRAASAADLATMQLSVQAELAQTYFQLRALDSQLKLLENTITIYAKAVELTKSQYRGGMATPSDVAQAETQLASVEAETASIERQRAELEHAIAVLIGKLPSSFTLPRGSLIASVPHIPLSVPSALLERRPDIAAAERRVAEANSMIGVARAAWFPSISLSGESASQGAGWHASPLSVWSFGPSLALSLFEGGKHIAANQKAWAQYEGAVASYRQTVLEAFKDVEDNLSGIHLLAKEAKARDRAVVASGTAMKLSMSQYREGLTTYLLVVTTQSTKLTSERSAIQIKGQQLIAAVNLIKALGGGWDSKRLNAINNTE